MKLILASNSRTRKEVLDKVGVIYEVIPSNIDEKSDKSDPLEYVMDCIQKVLLKLIKMQI